MQVETDFAQRGNSVSFSATPKTISGKYIPFLTLVLALRTDIA